MRELRAVWSIQSAHDLMNQTCKMDLGVEYAYIPRIKWWRVMDWLKLWDGDYVLSRASDIVLVRKMVAAMKEGMGK